MGLSFSYVLTGKGWAECQIDVDGTHLFMQASHLSDAFDSIVRATLSMLANGSVEAAIFNDEPGTYRWRLTPAGDRLNIRIVTYDEPFARENDPTGRLSFDVDCRLRTFAGAVFSAGQQLLATHGEDGYAEQWGHPFPGAPLAQLKQALRKG
ncbi:MAG: DUF1365 domain-containing protein [Mesorhizobium sp.]|uniref:hypothetical protein n=1 Tax=Mesorhizobium sp. TaxID=1871066 RepID=UPI00120F0A86|nr:hypothetical protein [Mesorhizobium sp.]TIT20602.1 MAG: DUF1365 domain-containing protein [Mesorhizobium sp.]TKB29829.1 MAG: DUF1365 domain-containing protein [Mesorhizobium sp.]